MGVFPQGDIEFILVLAVVYLAVWATLSVAISLSGMSDFRSLALIIRSLTCTSGVFHLFVRVHQVVYIASDTCVNKVGRNIGFVLLIH